MERLKRLTYKLRTLTTANERSSAGSNSTPLRLIRQSLPRYLKRNGFAFNPLSLFIIINGQCNLFCRMCDIGQGDRSSMFYRNMINGDCDFDNFCLLMREVAVFKPFISITSTEPLLYPRIDDAIAVVKDMGMEMNITTNGTLLERHAESFVKLGLDKLTISLDGPSEIHDTIRGVSGTFRRVMRGIDTLSRLKNVNGTDKPSIFINSVILDLNIHHMDRFFQSLPMEHIRRVGLMPVVFLTQDLAQSHNERFGRDYPATPTCLSGGIDLQNIDVDLIRGKVEMLKDRYGNRLHLYFRNDATYLKNYFRRPEVFLGTYHCVFPWFAAQVNARGDLLGLTRCYATTFGNVFEHGFRAAWNGPKMRKFRMDLQKYGSFPACSRCEGVLAH
ncbi:MAG: radical SAM protein [Candidatus Tectomicrobia bacterium]|nr:radical SAM protein [Candidatus Tectomicrobia bacterium]